MAAQGRLERRAPGKRLCESAFDGVSLLQRIRKPSCIKVTTQPQQQQLLLPIPYFLMRDSGRWDSCPGEHFFARFRVEHEVVFLSKQEFGPSRWANFSWPILTDRDCLTRKL